MKLVASCCACFKQSRETLLCSSVLQVKAILQKCSEGSRVLLEELVGHLALKSPDALRSSLVSFGV